MRRRWQSIIVTTIIIATMSAITIITATTTM
ncbi:hypothetical protein EN962_05955 [Mesorhizobium sp. M7A.F.Ca.CA.001.09.2.1]|uniref:Uncharacterized protein n=1 Tax=Mesorhizobium ciceri biovar biserrulae (strain HAMBI 2942 / LMG 23838 / WSM1271) TaxID=765698 RepID=E8THC1_MESCW|nr:hypothetical protein Mesci_4457 [Mesorhizobium ciceri biovar biserrulae WSM1271]RUX75598.1 hypothetical protein EN990_13215 [Mesorhizobium sp. M7A.F.Ca.US.005.03.1.1]RUY17630.1 hypothetical protein EN991_07060 [Mesorhizobium sp. M7A.F.Ca.US.005.03.2.1]RUY31772.1 hypothetical protein EN979_02450 [Mesorhizobium sp. M7A.F.Ca.US.001.04.2.1]RUY35474.1 hypothetical protein EN978_32115 [Mesorhizobium sp. M7A.F.Ca.US.001.04.1.1]RUY54148.1 hypothetical protein EN981_08565 [Mesorhizobium sp. M7A.F.Ca